MKIKNSGKKFFPMVDAICQNPLCEAEITDINAREVTFKSQGRTGWYSIICPMCGHEIQIPYEKFSPEFLEEMKFFKGMR